MASGGVVALIGVEGVVAMIERLGYTCLSIVRAPMVSSCLRMPEAEGRSAKCVRDRRFDAGLVTWKMISPRIKSQTKIIRVVNQSQFKLLHVVRSEKLREIFAVHDVLVPGDHDSTSLLHKFVNFESDANLVKLLIRPGGFSTLKSGSNFVVLLDKGRVKDDEARVERVPQVTGLEARILRRRLAVRILKG